MSLGVHIKLTITCVQCRANTLALFLLCRTSDSLVCVAMTRWLEVVAVHAELTPVSVEAVSVHAELTPVSVWMEVASVHAELTPVSVWRWLASTHS